MPDLGQVICENCKSAMSIVKIKRSVLLEDTLCYIVLICEALLAQMAFITTGKNTIYFDTLNTSLSIVDKIISCLLNGIAKGCSSFYRYPWSLFTSIYDLSISFYLYLLSYICKLSGLLYFRVHRNLSQIKLFISLLATLSLAKCSSCYTYICSVDFLAL